MKSHSPEFFKVTGNVLNVKNMLYDWNGSSDLSFVWHQHHQQQSCYRLTLHVNKETRERITYIFASLYCTIHFKALYLLLDQGPMLQSQLYFIPLPLPLPTWNRVAMNRGENIPLKKWDTATTPLHVFIRHPQLIYQRKCANVFTNVQDAVVSCIWTLLVFSLKTYEPSGFLRRPWLIRVDHVAISTKP